MEPPAVPPQWGWTDEAEAPSLEWWSGVEPAGEAPELQLDEDWVLLLDGNPYRISQRMLMIKSG